VLESAVVGLRLVQYAAAMVLMGSSLFLAWALPPSDGGSDARVRWARPLLIGAGLALAVAAILSIGATASVLTGSLAEGLKARNLAAVVSELALGKAALVRAGAAILAVVGLLATRPGRQGWLIAAALGGLATASLGWMGHGAATDGPLGQLHLASDVLHVLAGAVWIGALVGFVALLAAPDPGAHRTLHRALRGFSGIGSVLVAVLVLTGLVNSWILVGFDHLSGLWTTPYGRLLLVKLTLVVAMLCLAVANRYRHTPALGRALAGETAAEPALRTLRRSIALETALGFAVLAVVAGLGVLPPPAAAG